MTYLWSDIFVTLGFCRKNPPSKRWPFVTSLRNSPWDFHSELRGDGRETRAGLGWWWGKPKRSGTWRGLAGLTLAKQPLLFLGGNVFGRIRFFWGKCEKQCTFWMDNPGWWRMLVRDMNRQIAFIIGVGWPKTVFFVWYLDGSGS